MHVTEKASRWIERKVVTHGLVEGRDYAPSTTRANGRRGRVISDPWLTIETARRIVAEVRALPSERLKTWLAERERTPARDVERETRRGEAMPANDEPETNVAFPKVTERRLGGVVQLTVSARDLHATLGVRTDESEWMKRRITQFEFREDGDFERVMEPVGTRKGVFPKSGENLGGRPIRDYVLTLDAAKHVAMAERTPVGHAIRRYFIACERRLGEVAAEAAAAETARLETEIRRLADADRTGTAQPSGESARTTSTPDLVSLVDRLAALPGADAAFVERTMATLVHATGQGRTTRDASPTNPVRDQPPTDPTAPRPTTADAATEPTTEQTRRSRRPPRSAGTMPASASATPAAANAQADDRPKHLHRTSVGIVIDLRLPLSGSAAEDRLAVCQAFAGKPYDARTIKVWKTKYGRAEAAGRPLPYGDAGDAVDRRRCIFEGYDAVRAERYDATVAYRRAERAAFQSDVLAALWAKHRKELN